MQVYFAFITDNILLNFGFVLGLIALVWGIVVFAVYTKERRFTKNCKVHVRGECLSEKTSSGFTVRYEADGVQIEKEIHMNYSFLPKFKAGQALEIYYNEKDPQQMYIAGYTDRAYKSLRIIFGLLTGAFFIPSILMTIIGLIR